MCGIFGREITRCTAIFSAFTRFWLTLGGGEGRGAFERLLAGEQLSIS